MPNLLIAESGGTKTDWCFISDGIVIARIETAGLHPALINTKLEEEVQKALSPFQPLFEWPLHFYGSGCLHSQGREKVEMALKKIGFSASIVESDLVAAGKALYGNGSGWCAIMGTGSVLFRYENGRIVDVYGGKGHMNGDEGSGYYFGRLVWDAYRRGDLTSTQSKILEDLISTKVIQVEQSENKAGNASLAQVLAPYYKQFTDLHEKNIESFINSWRQEKVRPIKEIGVVGGYAFFNADSIREILKRNGVSLVRLIQKPIDVLIEQNVSDSYQTEN